MKRDERKAFERRITRSKAKDKGDVEVEQCEMPRQDDSDLRNSPSTSSMPYSPVSITVNTPEQPSLLIRPHMSDHNIDYNSTPVSKSQTDHDIEHSNVDNHMAKTNVQELNSLCSALHPRQGGAYRGVL